METAKVLHITLSSFGTVYNQQHSKKKKSHGLLCSRNTLLDSYVGFVALCFLR